MREGSVRDVDPLRMTDSQLAEIGNTSRSSFVPTFADVFNQAPDAMLLIDDRGSISGANRRVEDLFGISPAVLCGRTLKTIIPGIPDFDPTTGPQTIWTVGIAGKSPTPVLGRRADGGEFPVDVSLAPIERGTCGWILAVVRDATEQHRLLNEACAARRAAEEAVRVKGEFLGLAAHDLSQPVQTLEVMISAIEQHAGQPSAIAELSALGATSLARMRELLKTLLEMSRLDSAALKIHAQPAQVAEIFEYLARQFGPLARAKGLRFVTEPSGQIVETDASLLRGMLSNLLANAIRYTPAGEVRLRCTTGDDGQLYLEVSDTGIGIPHDQQKLIFEDFHRLQQTEVKGTEGFGLGLGIVRRLSTLLQLPVKVCSTVGSGSTFTVEVPANKVFELPQPRAHAPVTLVDSTAVNDGATGRWQKTCGRRLSAAAPTS
jgi:PAS domain S-box-containing protein